jgi:hypothetical protein
MSSFVVSDETINNVVTYVFKYGAMRPPACNKIIDFTKSFNDPDRLGREMLRMNVTAVNQCYGKEVRPKKYFFIYSKASVFKVLKSLQCYLYQCGEGRVPRRKLYRLLSELEVQITSLIIEDLKEYQEAKWD